MLTNDQYTWDCHFMAQAIQLAEQAAQNKNEPFGALLVKDNEVVFRGENAIYTQHDPTYHAELGLIRDFCQKNQITDLSQYTLYTSCEPCCMCSGAIVWSKVGRMVYSLGHDELAEIAGFNIMLGSDEVFAKSPSRPEVTKGILKEESTRVYQTYFQ